MPEGQLDHFGGCARRRGQPRANLSGAANPWLPVTESAYVERADSAAEIDRSSLLCKVQHRVRGRCLSRCDACKVRVIYVPHRRKPGQWGYIGAPIAGQHSLLCMFDIVRLTPPGHGQTARANEKFRGTTTRPETGNLQTATSVAPGLSMRVEDHGK